MPGWLTLEALKNDQTLDSSLNTRDDEALQRALDAAQSWVERHRKDIDYRGAWTVPLEIQLGTLRLAARWFVRRISPDGTVNMGGFGTVQIMAVDPDIYMQLGITGGFA